VAVLFDVLEFRGLNQATAFGKCEAFDRGDDVDLTGKKTGTNQVGAIDLNRLRGGTVNRPRHYLGTAKVFRPPQRTKDFADNRIPPFTERETC